MIPSLLFQVIFYLCIFIGDINYSEDSEVIRRESEILYSLRIPFPWVVIPRPAGRGRGSESLALFSEYHTCFVFALKRSGCKMAPGWLLRRAGHRCWHDGSGGKYRLKKRSLTITLNTLIVIILYKRGYHLRTIFTIIGTLVRHRYLFIFFLS